MEVGDIFKGVTDFAKENPALAGIITFGLFMLMSNMFGGNRGIFGTAASATKAGGAGLLVSMASALFSEDGPASLIPESVRDWIPDLTPEA